MADAANKVLEQILEKTITPVLDIIGRHIGYLIFYKSNIKSLEEGADQLENFKKDVEVSCDIQKRNNIETAPSTAGWVKKVEQAIKDAEDIETKTSQLKGCSLNLKTRYVMSRKSTKLVVVIQTLQKEVPKDITTNIVLPAGRLPGAAANHYSRGYKSRMETVEKIMKALKDDEISVIGICGLGGIGKTTMVHEVREIAIEQKLFQESTMAIVSQNLELFKIQGDLAEMLGLTKLKEEKNVIARADQLHKRLTNGNKVLVILDDVWSDLNLKDIGIPLGIEKSNCKVIITSREEGVCNATQKSIKVEALDEEEARALFRETAGEEQVRKNNLGEIANSIADECGGLPIALLTLSRALSNKDKGAWEDTLTKLKGGDITSIRGMEKEVYQSIKLSYDFLAMEKQEEAQWLLLICCQHKEDARVEVEKLAQYCLSLSLFKGVTGLVGARNRVYTLIKFLKSCFLLQDVDAHGGDGDEERGNEVVKVHDMVREVCLWIMSEEKEERDRAYMHIMDEKIDGGDKVTDEVNYTKVKLLLKASLPPNNTTVRHFQQMEDLRVLECFVEEELYTGPITPQSEFQFLANLRMLSIEGGDISEGAMLELTRLSKLEILSFWYSKVACIPRGIGQLSNLKLLDLRCDYVDDEVPIPRGMLTGLVKLESLYMGNHSFEEKDISELDSLLNLTSLQTVMALKDLQHFKFFEKLESFYFGGEGWNEYNHLNWCKAIELEGIEINWVLEDKMQSIVRRTEDLVLKDISDFTDPKIFEQFGSLMNLEMRDCNELEYIIGDDGIDKTTHSTVLGSCGSSSGSVFKNLESLKMYNMSNVKELCHNGRLPEGSLCKLKVLYLWYLSDIRYLWVHPTNPLCLVNLTRVEITNCPALEFIFPHSAAKCLAQLQILNIDDCTSLKAIVYKGGEGKTTGGGGSEREITQDPINLQIHFPKLTTVSIYNAPVESFYNLDNDNRRGQPLFNPLVMLTSLQNLSFADNDSIKSVFDFDGLEDAPSLPCELQRLELHTLPKLEHLYCQALPKEVDIFKNLRKLSVQYCEGLTYLISYSVAHMLVNLQELTVVSCKSMKVVICNMNEEECAEIEKKIVFPSLTKVNLEYMENLSAFCSSDQVCEFPSLESVYIAECFKIETFYSQIPRVARSAMLEENMSKRGGKTAGGEEIMEVSSDLLAHIPKLKYLYLSGTPKLQGFNNLDKATGRLLPCFNSMDNMSSTMEDIKVDGLDMVKQIIKGGTMGDFNEFAGCDWLQNLGALELRLCNSLDSVFDFEKQDVMGENVQVVTLPKLKILNLIQLSSLTCIFRCQMKDIFIPELQAIHVEICESLANVAASNLIKQLLNLRKITVKYCETMTSVFDFEGLDVMGENVPSILGALEDISLRWLPNVEHLCRSLPKEICVFQHLKTLKVIKCGSMASLIPFSVLHMLMNLQKLIVKSCENMKEVVAKINEEDDCGKVEKKIVFHSLRSIELTKLKNLSSFCSSDELVLEFPSLVSLSINKCPQMETFCCRLPSNDCSELLEENMSKGNGTITEGEIDKVPTDLVAQFSKLGKVILRGTPNLQGFYNFYASGATEEEDDADISDTEKDEDDADSETAEEDYDTEEDADDADLAAMEEDFDDVGDKPLLKNDVDESAQDLTARVTQFSSHGSEDDVDLSADNVDDIQFPKEGVDNEYDQCGIEALDHNGTSSSTPFEQGASNKLINAFPDASLAQVFVSPLSVFSSKVDVINGKTIALQNEVRESISSIEAISTAALKAMDLKVEDIAKEMKVMNLKLEEMKSDVNLKFDAILEAMKASVSAPATS